MNILSFNDISDNIPLFGIVKNLIISDSDKFKDSLYFDTLIRNNQVERALSIYSKTNHLIDLSSSVSLVSRFCDLKNFQKYEDFSQKNLSITKQNKFYQNALNWSVANDNIEQVSYLYQKNSLQPEWFNNDLFKIAVENNATKMIDFFIYEVRISFDENIKHFLEEKNPSLIYNFQDRIPFVQGDLLDRELFIKNFQEQKLFELKKKNKLKINI